MYFSVLCWELIPKRNSFARTNPKHEFFWVDDLIGLEDAHLVHRHNYILQGVLQSKLRTFLGDINVVYVVGRLQFTPEDSVKGLLFSFSESETLRVLLKTQRTGITPERILIKC